MKSIKELKEDIKESIRIYRAKKLLKKVIMNLDGYKYLEIDDVIVTYTKEGGFAVDIKTKNQHHADYILKQIFGEEHFGEITTQ